MGNFNRNKSYNRGDSDREMYKATCADCGRECEIPFRPTTGRPVYCRDDFKKHSPEGEDRGRDTGRRNDRGGSRNFSRDNSRGGSDREMFDATCANCGDKCKVPFQPRGDKEVLCSNCFEEKGGDPRRTSNNAASSQLNDIQAKLDRILELLSTTSKETSNKKPQTAKIAKEEVKTAKVQDEMVEEITENITTEAVEVPVEVEVKPKAKKKTSKKSSKTI